MDEFIDVNKDLTFPPGMKKLWGGSRHNTARGSFTTAICKDADGGCYLHIDAQPTLNESFVTAAGGAGDASHKVNSALRERLNHLAGEMDGVLHHADVGKGQFTYKLSGIDANAMGHIMDENPMATKVMNVYSKFSGSSQDYGVVYQGELALHDAVNQLPHADLKTTIARATNAINRSDKLPDLSKMGHLDEIEKRLAEKGLTNFRYVSFGKTGSCLEAETKAGTKVAVMLRRGGVERQALPQHLQPLYEFATNTHHVEVTPMLNNRTVTESQLNGLRDAVSAHVGPNGERFEVTDRVMRNLGVSHNGNAYYLDGDGIERVTKTASTPVASAHDPRWVDADGKWKQYHDFRADHEAFNSPLHQAGGKLTPKPLAVPVGAVSASVASDAVQARVAGPPSTGAIGDVTQIPEVVKANTPVVEQAGGTVENVAVGPKAAPAVAGTAEDAAQVVKPLEKAVPLVEHAGSKVEVVAVDAGKKAAGESGKAADTAKGIGKVWKDMHWGGKTAIIGGTVLIGASLGYWAFRVKHDRANQGRQVGAGNSLPV